MARTISGIWLHLRHPFRSLRADLRASWRGAFSAIERDWYAHRDVAGCVEAG